MFAADASSLMLLEALICRSRALRRYPGSILRRLFVPRAAEIPQAAPETMAEGGVKDAHRRHTVSYRSFLRSFDKHSPNIYPPLPMTVSAPAAQSVGGPISWSMPSISQRSEKYWAPLEI